ncbi:hypothetical protein NHX12_034373, partial [Muraenolepis orangiensis]
SPASPCPASNPKTPRGAPSGSELCERRRRLNRGLHAGEQMEQVHQAHGDLGPGSSAAASSSGQKQQDKGVHIKEGALDWSPILNAIALGPTRPLNRCPVSALHRSRKHPAGQRRHDSDDPTDCCKGRRAARGPSGTIFYCPALQPLIASNPRENICHVSDVPLIGFDSWLYYKASGT